ncbi:MAG: type III polyketide synthase [Acidobacteria bacterium]|nr:type III polyketide synthase [Acidobacteriota bacterium]
MPGPRIAAIGTAVPAHRFTQPEALRLAGYGDRLRRGFFEHSGIEARHLAIDPEHFRPDETVDQLNERFAAASRALAAEAARTALDRAGRGPDEIDFLATTTCTGRLCPSLDAILIRDLDMNRRMQRVHVGDTGCASGIVALQQACNHLAAFPGHRALVVAVEICSATYYLDDDPETAVANAIFAAGAGAVILEIGGGGVGPEVVVHRTRIESEHIGDMGFTYPRGRPRILLSRDIRQIAARMIRDLAGEILDERRLRQEDVRFWVIHSAGRRVLEEASRLLGFGDGELRFSRHVLRNFGNMSSATVFFVLNEVLGSGEPRAGDWGLMIALGPGFAAEGALLRW